MKKNVYVVVVFDEGNVSDSYFNDDLSEDLSNDGYGSIEELINNNKENCGELLYYYCFGDEGTYFIQQVDSVGVFEGRPSNNDPFDVYFEFTEEDDLMDIKDLVRVEIREEPVPSKGFAYKIIRRGRVVIATMIVDDTFIFDPSKLLIKDYLLVEYDGHKCKIDFNAWDEPLERVFYYNGVALNPKKKDEADEEDW